MCSYKFWRLGRAPLFLKINLQFRCTKRRKADQNTLGDHQSLSSGNHGGIDRDYLSKQVLFYSLHTGLDQVDDGNLHCHYTVYIKKIIN
jgi:hypothetical protein